MSFLQVQVIFPSNIALIFIAIRHNSSVPVLAQTLYILFKKGPLKWNILKRLSARYKIRQIINVSFEMTSQFYLQILCHS